MRRKNRSVIKSKRIFKLYFTKIQDNSPSFMQNSLFLNIWREIIGAFTTCGSSACTEQRCD